MDRHPDQHGAEFRPLSPKKIGGRAQAAKVTF